MRDVFGIHEIRARHVDEAPSVRVGFARRRVARVDDGDPIHIEIVAVSSRVDWADRDFPYAIGALGHRCALAKAGQIAAGQPDLLCFWSENAEHDLMIGQDLRRNDLGGLRPAKTACPCRRVGRLGWLSGATGAKWGVGAILTVLFLSGILQVMNGSRGVAFVQEAYVNGFERKQTDYQAAAFFRAHYDGQRILIDLGQHGIIPQKARIRLTNLVNEATAWESALAKPSLSVGWIVEQEGDGVWKFPVNRQDLEGQFEKVLEVTGPFEKPLRIYRRLPR